MEFTARARAFSGEGIRENRFMVDGDVVRVWDEIGGHFTTCHSISPATMQRLRKIADEKAMYDERGNPRGNGPRCATCGELVAWGSHPMCKRSAGGKLIRQ